MKISSLLALAAVVLASACKEIPPVIGECQTERRVIIEEFTGVRCVNCPIGSQKIEQLIEQYGEDKIIAIGIHSGYFSVPYSFSVEDFTTAKGTGIDNLLGPVTSYPAATINRKLFSAETQRPLGVSSWSGYIASELCREPLVDVDIRHVFDTASRQLNISVEIDKNVNENINEKLGLTVLLTESGMVSAQLDLGGVDTFYTHKHVLRDIITDYQGLQIHDGNAVFETQTQTFSYTLPNNWQANKCEIVAFVHYKNESNKFDILQATHKKVK